jgi:hypothetical protein
MAYVMSKNHAAIVCALLMVATLACRSDGESSSPSGPQPDTATELPDDAPDAVWEAVDLVSPCDELENLAPIMTAWDQLCQHATASGAEIAAQRIEACRAEHLARRRAEHPAPPGEPVVEGRGSEAFEAGLRDGMMGAKYDLLQPLSLDACAPASD